jgi:hypothetical protein
VHGLEHDKKVEELAGNRFGVVKSAVIRSAGYSNDQLFTAQNSTTYGYYCMLLSHLEFNTHSPIKPSPICPQRQAW